MERVDDNTRRIGRIHSVLHGWAECVKQWGTVPGVGRELPIDVVEGSHVTYLRMDPAGMRVWTHVDPPPWVAQWYERSAGDEQNETARQRVQRIVRETRAKGLQGCPETSIEAGLCRGV